MYNLSKLAEFYLLQARLPLGFSSLRIDYTPGEPPRDSQSHFAAAHGLKIMVVTWAYTRTARNADIAKARYATHEPPRRGR